MSLKFNGRGDLSKTIGLSYEKFNLNFGYNAHRAQLITNALPFFRAFQKAGCATVYIGGSFVSEKMIPEDIDICFDITSISKAAIEKEIPEFFVEGQRDRIRLEFFSEDREGNHKGLVILNLTEIIRHDKK